MPCLKGVADRLPLFCFLPLASVPLFSLLPEPLEFEPWYLSLPNHKAWAEFGFNLFGFYRLHPRYQLLQGPVLLVHDVVVEKVSDDVLDPHLAP